MTLLGEKVSTEVKVMLHLSKYSRLRDLYVVPPATTQQGIADSVGASRNYVSVVLVRLIEQGLVIEHTSRVVGSRRKKRAYFLTARGDSYAKDLKDDISKSTVRVLTDDGVVDMKYSELGKVIGPVPDATEIVKMIGDDGLLDRTKSAKERATATVTPEQEKASAPSIPVPSGYLGTRKICLLGDAGVGKTSLIRRYVYSMFDDKYVTTIGTNVSSKILHLDQKGRKVIVKLLVWDLMGNPRFKKVRETAIRGAGGAIIVCDVTRKETLRAIEEWTGSMLESAGDIPWVLIVNKCDLKADDGITHEDASECASRYGVPYYFTSAKTSENVEEVFRVVAGQILSGEELPEPRPMGRQEAGLVDIIDAIIDAYCSRHGGHELAMNDVRIAFEKAAVDLERPTREVVLKLIDELLSRSKGNKEKMELEKKMYLDMLEKSGK
jgi:small GTP-binding protein